MNRQVKNCLDGCPFWHSDVWGKAYCSENSKRIITSFGVLPPIWCPLREAPITVSLIQVQNEQITKP